MTSRRFQPLFLFAYVSDLKYENVMFANKDPGAEVKVSEIAFRFDGLLPRSTLTLANVPLLHATQVIDFGLSKKYGLDETLHEAVGE